MTTFIPILRGINVAGKHRVAMADLKALYESQGARNVATYIQSGNVIFEVGIKNPSTLKTSISKGFEKKFGFSSPVLVRTVENWKQVFENNPFLENPKIDPTFLHVTFFPMCLLMKPLKKLRKFPLGRTKFKF